MIKIKQVQNLASTIQKAEANAIKHTEDNFEKKFNKNTAFNKNFGTRSGEVAEGNHTHAKVSTTVDGLMSKEDKSKLNGIETGANNYKHPSTHAPSIIVQDANNRFVTDTEKSTWNAKASTAVATTSANGLMASADKSKLDNTISGASTFNSITGVTITIGRTMPNANYRVAVTPTSNPDGSLGEIWVESKTKTTFVVKCSGSTTTCTFDWIVTI